MDEVAFYSFPVPWVFLFSHHLAQGSLSTSVHQPQRPPGPVLPPSRSLLIIPRKTVSSLLHVPEVGTSLPF